MIDYNVKCFGKVIEDICIYAFNNSLYEPDYLLVFYCFYRLKFLFSLVIYRK